MSILTNQVGINISENSLQLVEISKKFGKVYLENVDEEFFDETLEENQKETKFIHILQNAFNEIILRTPLKTSKVLISLPLSFFKIFEIPIDKNLTQNDLNEYLLWEFNKLFPSFNKFDSNIQKVFLDTPTYQPYKRVSVFALNKEILKRLFKFCVRNNLHLKAVDNCHNSSNGILKYYANKLNGISIYLENKKASAMVFSNNKLIFSKINNFTSIPETLTFLDKVQNEVESRNLSKSKSEQLFLLGSSVNNELLNQIKDTFSISPVTVEGFSELKLDITHLERSKWNNSKTKFNPALGMALRLIE